MKATKADFDAALHPTAAEELVTTRTPSARHVRAAAEEAGSHAAAKPSKRESINWDAR